MENLQALWAVMSLQRRIIVIGATIGVFVLILTMARLANAPQMTLLYSGLDATAAGEVVSSLEASGTQYEVRGTNIYVTAKERDQLRMRLASDGLPRVSGAGYELLEKMTGFGTTSQMFDAAYWRAKEGELARTITGNDGITSARVHISNAGSNPFQAHDAVTASVTIQSTAGAALSQKSKAIQFLVASAVAGLDPSNVTVIDGASGNIISADAQTAAGADPEARALLLQKRVERLLEARVGAHHYVVEVSVETDRDQETVIQRTLDPSSRIVISTDSEESTRESTNSGPNGSVTVASNLPTGDASAGDRSSNSQNALTRERVNYDVSQTEREIKRAAGAIKRITVAVMVDGTRTTNEAGELIWAPRTESELEDLQALVQSAIGYNSDRGDTVTIKTLQFEETALTPGTSASDATGNGLLSALDLQTFAKLAFLGLVALGTAAFVIRPALRQSAGVGAQVPALAAPVGGKELALEGPQQRTRPKRQLSSPVTEAFEMPDLPELPQIGGQMDNGDEPFALPALGTVTDFDLGEMPGSNTANVDDLPALPAFSMADLPGDDEDDPVERLRKLIEERRDETVEILRGWMEEKA